MQRGDRSHGARRAGAVGILSSALVCAIVHASDAAMGMTALLSVLLAQLLWNPAAALLLVRRG